MLPESDLVRRVRKRAQEGRDAAGGEGQGIGAGAGLGREGGFQGERREADKENNIEGSSQDSDARQHSSQDDMEQEFAEKVNREKARKRRRRRDGDGDNDDEDDYVEARMPRDLLKKTSLLASKLGLSVRHQLAMVAAVYELSGLFFL